MKGKKNFCLLFISLFLALTYSTGNAQTLSPWPMFRHDTNRTARSPYLGPQGNQLLWQYTFDDQIISSPVIGKDGTIYIGKYGWGGALYAINSDGSLKWQYGYIQQMNGTPALSPDENTIYAAKGYGRDTAGGLFALNTSDGGFRWFYPMNPTMSSPLVTPDGKIYIGSEFGSLYCINPDGSLLWQQASLSSQEISSSPALGVDDSVIVGADGVYSVDRNTGQTKWKVETPGSAIYLSSPAIDKDGTIYIGTAGGTLYSISSVGAVNWAIKLGYYTYSSPAIGNDGTIYIGVHQADGSGIFYAIYPNGSIKWQFSTGSIDSSPAVDSNGIIYFAANLASGGRIFALKPDGSLAWQYPSDGFIGGYMISSPAISQDRRLFIGSQDNHLYAIGGNLPSPIVTQEIAASNLGPQSSTNNRSGFASEPVNTATGNYLFSRVDFVIPGRGIPFVFQRTYNCQDSYSGPLGKGWTHSYNIILKERLDGSVSIKWGDGHSDFFDHLPDGTYAPRYAWGFDFLTKDPNGSFRLTKKNQTGYSFNSKGQLLAVTDRNGNNIRFNYDSSSNLATIVDTVGRTIALSYNAANQIIQIASPIGQVFRYGYDSSGMLASVTNPNGDAALFAYDDHQRLSEIRDERGVKIVANSYDGQDRVVTQTNGRGYTTAFSYGTPQSNGTTDTAFTDPKGNVTVHTHDPQLRLIQVTEAGGNKVSYTYDGHNNRTSITNQNNNVSLFSYDNLGNILSITDPPGNISLFTYDLKNNLTGTTNAKGFSTKFEYDTQSNLTRITDAIGGGTAFAYDSFGQLIRKTDARGNATQYTFDAQGNLTQVTDALGGKTKLSYDGIGRLLTMTNPNGNRALAAYDAISRLSQITDPLGNKTRFGYDSAGNLVGITDAKGNQTQYSYDQTDNLTAVTDALGHITRYSYDANNNRIALIDANAHTTSYTFDALNRLASILDPLDNSTFRQYDAVGNVSAVTDAKGMANTFTYDTNNRLKGIQYGDASSVSYTYDANGNRLTMVDGRGVTTYSYDALNRLIAIAHPEGKVSYAYDSTGNRVKLTYPNGNIVTYAYDTLNRLTRVIDWHGRATTYGYDASSNLTQVSYPNQTKILYTYDFASRLIDVKHARGILFAGVGYTLDQLGNRTKMDLNVIGLKVPVKSFAYSYDALSQLLLVEKQLFNKSNHRTQYTYDPVGNRIKLLEFDFGGSKGWLPTGTTNYTYDGSDRLLSAGDTSFNYDANGNRIKKLIYNNPVESYTYDYANRLIQVIQPNIQLTYVYDGDGNKTKNVINSHSLVTSFSFLNDVGTALPVLLQESGPANDISYIYGLGLISEELISKGLKVSPPKAFFYHPDGLGSTVALTDQLGLPEAIYGYDGWGNLLEEYGNVPNRFLFTGEEMDDFTGLYYLRARWYDPQIGRFISKDKFGGTALFPQSLNRYVYTFNNPPNFTDRTGFDPSMAYGEAFLSELAKNSGIYISEHLIIALAGIYAQSSTVDPAIIGTFFGRTAASVGPAFTIIVGPAINAYSDYIQKPQMDIVERMARISIDVTSNTLISLATIGTGGVAGIVTGTGLGAGYEVNRQKIEDTILYNPITNRAGDFLYSTLHGTTIGSWLGL